MEERIIVTVCILTMICDISKKGLDGETSDLQGPGVAESCAQARGFVGWPGASMDRIMYMYVCIRLDNTQGATGTKNRSVETVFKQEQEYLSLAP